MEDCIRQRAQEGTGCDMIKACSRMKIVGIERKGQTQELFLSKQECFEVLIGHGKLRKGSCQKHLGNFKPKGIFIY